MGGRRKGDKALYESLPDDVRLQFDNDDVINAYRRTRPNVDIETVEMAVQKQKEHSKEIIEQSSKPAEEIEDEMKREIVRKDNIRRLYMEKQNIETLYASIEKEDFDKFQNIMDEVRNGKIFELSDIGKLCDVFLIEWKYIEPFQYSYIQKMILLSIDGTDKNAGFEILADKLNEIEIKAPIHVQSFLYFIFFNYSDDECMYFASLLAKQTMKETFKNDIIELCDTKDSRMRKILQKILEKF